MMIVDNKQIGFIYKNNKSIDKIFKEGEVVFEKGFLREKTSTTLPITFGGVGKDLRDYKIYGNTYQNSTSGKNLLNYIDTFFPSGGGLTNVINEDGSITTTGVPTSNYTPLMAQYNIIDELEDGQVYTISSETQNQYVYVQVNARKIAGGTDYIYNSNSRTAKFTVDKSKYNKYDVKIQTGTMSAWGSSSKTITNKYMLEKGNSGTTFEPYTNGASPNPDYPQEIVSCGGLITDSQDENYGKYKIPVNVRSDNLFDINWYFNNCVTHNCSKELIGNSIKISFTAGADAYIGEARNSSVGTTTATQNIAIGVENNTQYTFIASSLPRCYITYMDKNYDILNSSYIRFDSSYTKSSYTFTTPENCKYVAFRMGIQDSEYTEWTFSDIQLVEGSTVPDKYIPYYNETTNIYLDEPLRKIGDYTDYIDFKNGKIVRNVGNKLIDGSLYWVTSQFASGKRIYTLATTNIDSNIKPVNENTDKALIIADKYKTESVEDILTVTKQYAIGLSKTNYLSIQNQAYTRSADLIQSLTDEPVELNYALLTATEESITLPSIPTINGNNTLNIETELTPSQVYIKYKSNT